MELDRKGVLASDLVETSYYPNHLCRSVVLASWDYQLDRMVLLKELNMAFDSLLLL